MILYANQMLTPEMTDCQLIAILWARHNGWESIEVEESKEKSPSQAATCDGAR